MQIKNELQLDFKDVLIEPKRSNLETRNDVDLKRKFKFKNTPNRQWEGVPIIAANMDSVGTISMAKALSKMECLTALHKHYDTNTLIDYFSNKNTPLEEEDILSNTSRLQHTFYSMGITNKDIEKFETVLDAVGYWGMEDRNPKNSGIKMVCIDVANGYMEKFVRFCQNFKRNHPNIVIMAGNVVTGNMVEELIFHGVDIVKAGIGPGSACTTRKVAGVGRPQLSTIIECADSGHGVGGMICGDGGCTCPADISKGFGAGADFIMLGGMLAGHSESEMELTEENGELFMSFYGMSSSEAMKKYSGGVAEYRASEGRVLKLPFRGEVTNTMNEILGGIRSTCTYVGAKQLKELSKRTTFYRVNNQLNEIYSKEQRGK